MGKRKEHRYVPGKGHDRSRAGIQQGFTKFLLIAGIVGVVLTSLAALSYVVSGSVPLLADIF